MTDVSLIHTSGGLIGDVITDSLRQATVDGDAKFLADPSTFTGRDGATPTRSQLSADQEAAFRACVALWSAYAAELDGDMDVSRVREKLVLPMLDLFGFTPAYQRAKLPAGDRTWTVSHLGWDGPDTPPISVVAVTDLDARANRARSAHEELQGYLNAATARWGLLTNGRVLRLLRDYHHTRTRGYVEFDLAAMFEAGSYPDFLALWRLCHASRFLPQTAADTEPDEPDSDVGGEGDDTDGDDDTAASADAPEGQDSTLLERLYAKALTAGVAAGRRLQPQVRQAITLLANGLLEGTPGLRDQVTSNPDMGRDLYRELLTVLYRVLFLLFAEQRGMLNGANPLYDETYSLTRLRATATTGRAEPRRTDLWEGLKTTFRAFSDEDDAAALGVYPYNGFLFDQTRTPLATGGRIANTYLTRAVHSLTTVTVGGTSMHVDYRNLGVEELGAVYESLLDYTLAVAGTATLDDDNKKVAPGQAYLARISIERADLASFYTPTDLVELLLTRSLDPLVEQRLADAGDNPQAQVDAILDLKVIDPACGSAAILVGALDRLAYAVAKARSNPHEPLTHDLAHARREVLQSCIYGAEKDPFAAELAKVALWIHCVVPDQPLTFLDHHIVCGDSLVGWPLLNVPTRIENAAFQVTGARGPIGSRLTRALNDNKAFTAGYGDLFQTDTVEFTLTLPDALHGPEYTPGHVRAKSQAFRDWQASPEYAVWKQTADIWTAAHFWTEGDTHAIPTSRAYSAALDGRPDPVIAATAATILADINPIHWPLAFPEIHARGGFDLVIGNPPWEQYKGEEQPFFRQHMPRIAAMTSETRKKAIADLEHTDPTMYARWKTYQAGQGRLAHFAKSSGRYTRTPNEANTYVLFTELAADSSSHVGLIVKSGIATDAAQSAVWKRLVAGGRVRHVLDIVNQAPSGKRVFTAVAPVERFSILHLGPAQIVPPEASMLNFGVEAAASNPTRPWPIAELRTFAPRTETLPSTGDVDEIGLALELQDRLPTLDFSEDDGRNPWHLKYSRLFDSSGAKSKGWLLRGPTLEAQGFTLGKNKRYKHPDGREALPVYEGQMANRWDHRSRTFEGYQGRNMYGAKPDIPWVTDEQHQQAEFEVQPRYWMSSDIAASRLDEVVPEGQVQVALRAIGRTWTDRRLLRVGIMPRTPALHGLPILVVPRTLALAAVGILNSMTMDFLVRLHTSSGNVSPWAISQCASPLPGSWSSELVSVTSSLSLTSTTVAEAFGVKPIAWDPMSRLVLDARADALVARAYELTTAQYELVLNHFKLLEKIETRDVGEYRSKRLRLEAFEEIGGGR